MRNRKLLMSALLGGAFSVMTFAPQVSGQQPRTNPPQRSGAAAEAPAAASETLHLPPDQPIVVLSVQSPSEVRVGQSFDYQIRVQNNSKNIAVHDLVISQLAGEGFEIESAKVQDQPSGKQAKRAGQRQEPSAAERKQSQQKAQAEQQEKQRRTSDEQKGRQDKPSDRPSQPESEKAQGDEPQSDQRQGDKPEGDKPEGDKPEGDKPEGDKAASDQPAPDESAPDESEDAKAQKEADAQSEQADAEQSKSAQRSSVSSKRDRSGDDSQNAMADDSRWTIDRLMPGESRTIMVTASSDDEGAGNVCVAVESYVPALCLTTRFTKPELEIVKQAPEVANICDEIRFDYLVRNTGTGDLQRFTVRDDLPEGLQTIDGSKKLEFTLDDGLKAGGVRKFEARLRATKTGDFTSRATVEGSEGVEARSNRAGTKVQKADLALAIEGPQAQAVGGLANYTVRITNRGDAPAPGTQLRVYFPRSADLVRAGQPQRSSQAVETSTSTASNSDDEQAAHQHEQPAGDQPSADRDEESQAESDEASKQTDQPKKEQQQEQKQQEQQQQEQQQQEQQQQEQQQQEQQQQEQQQQEQQQQEQQQQEQQQQEQQQQEQQQQNSDDAAGVQAQADSRSQGQGDARDQARRAQNRENQERKSMAQHHWQLGTLAPGQTVEVTYVLRPYEGGELEQAAVAEYVCATAQDRELLRAETETTTEILMLAGLRLTAVDDQDPVSAGQNVTYTIAVLNQGNAPAHNIEIKAKLPKELKFVEAKGATSGEGSENEVTFDPVETLEPGKQAVWQVIASVNEGVDESSQNSLQVELDSDDLEETITSEEPTSFFQAEKRTARSSDSDNEATEKK